MASNSELFAGFTTIGYQEVGIDLVPHSTAGTAVSFDGTVIAFTSWVAGNDGPLVLAAHGTGFCKEIFAPIATELGSLMQGFEIRALDQRGHGDSGMPETPVDWWDSARDALAVLGGASGAFGVGHSLGGVTLAMAELLAPGTFSALLLLEPVFLAGPIRETEDGPLIRATLKRKHRFVSPDVALERWEGREAFAQWDERVLRAYAHGGLRATNGLWELKCAPKLEAEFYKAATRHGAFNRLEEVGAPVHVIAGQRSSVLTPAFVESIRSRFLRGTSEIVAGLSHFLPMEQPDLIARRVSSLVDGEISISHL